MMTSRNKSSAVKLVRTGFKFFVILILIVYVTIWLFSPFAVRYFATPALQGLGVSLSEESSVRFNPFSSTLSIDDLSLVDKNNVKGLTVEQAEVSIHLHRLLLKQLYFSEFSFTNVMLRVEKTPETLVLAGIDLSLAQVAKDEVVDENANTSEPNIEVILPELNILGFLVDAYLNGTPQQLLVDDLVLQNVQLSRDVQALDLSLLAKINGAPLNIASSLALQTGIGQVDTTFSLQQLGLGSISPLLVDVGAQLSGDLSLTGAATVDVKPQKIRVMSEQIRLSLDALSVAYNPWIVEGKKDVLTLNNLQLDATPQGLINSLSASLATQFEGGNLAIDRSDNSVADWQKIDFTTQLTLLDMHPKIAIDELNVESLQLSNNKQSGNSSPLVSIEQLLVSDIKFADNILSVDTVSLAGLLTNVKVSEEKSIVGLVDTASLQAVKPEVIDMEVDAMAGNTAEVLPTEVENTPVAEPTVMISMQKFVLLDDAFINISDASVTPAFTQKITIETLLAGPFDSADIHLQSPFELAAKDEEYLQITAGGYVSPFADRLNASFNGKINEVNLLSISPYVKGALGFEMKTGQLDIGFGGTLQMMS